MKKILLFLLILSFYVGDKAVAEISTKIDNMSIFFSILRPDAIVPISGDNSIGVKKVVNEYGGGITYNGLRIGVNQYYEGYRVFMGYDFARNYFVNPYIGATYVFGVDGRIQKNSKIPLNGADAVVGGSVNIFNMVKPYIEYGLYSSIIHYGVRIHLNKGIKRD